MTTRPDEPDLESCVVLIAEEEPSIAVSLNDSLAERGARVVVATSIEQALEELVRQRFDVVVADVDLTGGGIAPILDEVQKLDSKPPVILLATYLKVEAARKGLSRGAFDYATKPFPDEKITRMVANAWRLTRLTAASSP